MKRETAKNPPVVGAVREPPAPEHGPFSYRTAPYDIRVFRDRMVGRIAYAMRSYIPMVGRIAAYALRTSVPWVLEGAGGGIGEAEGEKLDEFFDLKGFGEKVCIE